MTAFAAAVIALLILCFFAGCGLVLFAQRRRSPYRAIFLDVDGTLFDFDRCEAAALTDAFRALGLAAGEKECAVYHRQNDACWKALERGEITRAELKVTRFVRTFEELGVSADPAQAAERYEERLKTYSFLFPDAEDAVAALSRRYDVYLVTNGLKTVQEAKLAPTRIPAYCAGIYISEAVGHAKPAKEFFDVIFRDHPRLRRKTTLIAGDSLSSDIRGGMNAGIATCWVNPSDAPLPDGYRVDMQVRSVSELNDIL